jgi:hypothetical protein
VNGPYARFLATADVAVWSECLDELAARAAAADDEQLAEVLGQGLCVAHYLRWLARVSGELAVATRADEHLGELRGRVVAAGARESDGWRRCWALVLVCDRYLVHAHVLVGESGITTPEHAVLLVSGDDIARLAGLRRLVRGTPPTTFLPAVFDYTQALVNIGEVTEAQHLLATGGWDDDGPLLIELRANIHERLGQWPAAFAAYCRSPWPAHRYRAAVVGTITGQWSEMAALEFDEPMRRVLFDLDDELDQAGLNRSVAFLNACLWRPVESWMLELELGKLCFRRRQFAEGDVHLSRALLAAPRAARQPIADLRFTNITWLTGADRRSTLNLLPEALTAGDAAVRLGGDDDTTSSVRTWMADNTGNLSLIPASVAGWSAYDRVAAFDALDQPALAIDAAIEAVETCYHHRAVGRLIRSLHAAGLVRAVVRLAEIVLSESETSFFALWETCQTLHGLLGLEGVTIDDPAVDPALEPADAPSADASDDSAAAGDDADAALQHLVSRCHERLAELSQFDFMNAMRASQVAREAGDEDLAEELLLRAAKQAEGVSELMAVALERRTGSHRSVHSDQEALACLARARTGARDRLERLEIARELLAYGAIRDGQAILAAEGVLSAHTPLSHSEITVALQCAQSFADDDSRALARRAARRLAQDAAAGILGPYPQAYADRLIETVERHVPSVADQVREILGPELLKSMPTEPWAGESVDGWSAMKERIDALLSPPTEDEPGDMGAQLDELCATASFGLRLLLVTRLREKLAGLHQEIRGVTPTLPAAQVPVRHWYDAIEGERVIMLCYLWRSRILGADDAAETADLDEFFAHEQRLADAWEQLRREQAAPVLHGIALAADALRHALTKLLDADQRDTAHPILRALFTEIQRDVDWLTAEIADQAATARRQAGP